MRLPSILLPLVTLAFSVTASKVVDLDGDNFDKLVGAGKPALVEFFAPWLLSCRNLAPVYEQLADAFPTGKVLIAKTDADGAGKSLGKRFGVKGYPTLKWFGPDGGEPVDYEGGRDLDSLAKFVTEKSGVKSSIKPPPPPAALEVDNKNYHQLISSGKDVLIAFTAPWCGHCKSLKPVYEKVATAFKNEKNVVVAQMNADADENKEIASEVGVQGFPTIKFFPKDGSGPVNYASARSEEAFVEFLNEKAGTHRAVGGRLLPTAGKVLALDQLASKFFSAASSSDRSSILEQAQAYVAKLTGSAKTGAEDVVKRANGSEGEYYIKAMQRVVEKGEDWLSKETTRIGKLLQSPSLAPEKLDELQRKNNILSAFVHRKFDEAADALSDASLDDVEEAVRHATASVKVAAGQATDRVKQEL
ncbi:hypothetical protein FFLO_06227 [Filobasidium floriforme]|uniref:protein disulfide-isomerase n=1 Tax=Filobasidium floriforme TaxID=5210 RepID=A0A8K0JGQ4_9TREE|nr:hypothetical protein FFLO_06227 [Filobasidium floriforme]